MSEQLGSDSRRDFIKKAAYVVPTIMSVNVALVSARAGSYGMDDKMNAKGIAPKRGSRDGERPPRRTERAK